MPFGAIWGIECQMRQKRVVIGEGAAVTAGGCARRAQPRKAPEQ